MTTLFSRFFKSDKNSKLCKKVNSKLRGLIENLGSNLNQLDANIRQLDNNAEFFFKLKR